jgi:hypothetical protein
MGKVQEVVVITAQNVFTTWKQLDGKFNLFIQGLTNSTVVLQGSPDAGSKIYDLETFDDATNDNTMHVGEVANSDWMYRVGIKTGGYGSDTVTVRLEQET